MNDEVIHGIPSDRRTLKEGDILSLYTGVVLDGYYGDSARISWENQAAGTMVRLQIPRRSAAGASFK